ncbi:hypothetical protein [Legionella jordanis]|uniref:ABC transporter substrate-binding protein n=1 Tax=Legionella jordanis TaxID=456 RepID=A0A0W0V8Q9_9GAMM|nr:hypothetical protein [Legionella jordanis]KTD16519.1 hypothetical protein Ljor_0825 [Legionella jordanis]VEH12020.1 Uncharacterised protein [Legionella jordanis]
MKRIALLAVTAALAVLISACGNQSEKKAENGAATTTEQTQGQNTGTTDNTNKTNQ